MQVIDLVRKHTQILDKFSIGEELGYGADGQVFELSNHLDRVIKFGLLYDNFEDPLSIRYLDIENSIKYIKDNNPHICACVYDFSFLTQSSRKFINGTQDYILYYYVMERLHKISEDEKKVFHTIFSHEDRNLEKHFSEKEVVKILNGLSVGLEFDVDKVKIFHSKVLNSFINHLDMHPRNIMKTHDGNFKLIDFDRIHIEGNNNVKKY